MPKAEGVPPGQLRTSSTEPDHTTHAQTPTRRLQTSDEPNRDRLIGTSQHQALLRPAQLPNPDPSAKSPATSSTQLKADPQLNDVWIEGEVRSFNRSGAGHYYFDLADSREDGKSDAVFDLRLLPPRQPRHGRSSRAIRCSSTAAPMSTSPRGSLQIIVDDLRPIGEGVLQAEYDRLFEKSQRRKGWFKPETQERLLPPFPRSESAS